MKKIFYVLAIVLIAIMPVMAQDSLALVTDTLAMTQDPSTVVAEVVTPVVTEPNLLLNIVLPGVLGILSVLFLDTAKYLKGGNWNMTIFLNSKLKPFAYSVLVLVVAYLITVFFKDNAAVYINMLNEFLPIIGFTVPAFVAEVIDKLSKKAK